MWGIMLLIVPTLALIGCVSQEVKMSSLVPVESEVDREQELKATPQVPAKTEVSREQEVKTAPQISMETEETLEQEEKVKPQVQAQGKKIFLEWEAKDSSGFESKHSYFLAALHEDGKDKGRMDLGMAVAIAADGDQCMLLTNSHVVSGAKIIWLSRWSGYPITYDRVEARLIWEDQTIDAAILAYSAEGSCLTSKINDELLPLGADIITYGQPVKHHGVLTKGVVGGYWYLEDRGVLMVSDLLVVKGNSGAGVFSKDNELVGLVTGRTAEKVGYAYIVPICRILPLLPTHIETGYKKRRWKCFNVKGS